MAARAWVVGIIGLFASWLAFQFIGGMIGTMWGIYDVLNSTGLIDKQWDNRIVGIKQTFLATWSYLPLIVFASFVVYIILESLRRRPEDYYI